jgi:amino acid transporter
LLLIAFAFAVMADPVSSVAYAVEAALRALNGDLALLIPTMSLVVAIIALVIVNYRQLIARYPQGGGASAAVGEAFGDGWSFIPVGALVVDFVLTIAISVSAGASAVIAFFPGIAPYRIPLALGLVLVVGGLTWFGHAGRLLFAVLTIAFIAVAVTVLILGLSATPHPTGTITDTPGHAVPLAVILAFPVAMALATGVEAPSSAIAQLGELDNDGRRRFGQITLWLTLRSWGRSRWDLRSRRCSFGSVFLPPSRRRSRSWRELPLPHRSSQRSSSSQLSCCCRLRARRSRRARVC